MDVVNEVIADGPNDNAHDMRDSRWYQVLGEGCVDEGVRLAQQHPLVREVAPDDPVLRVLAEPGEGADDGDLLLSPRRLGVAAGQRP